MWKLLTDNWKTPITYLVGVTLWINAISDGYLWVDSPDCFFFKCDYVHWNHDIHSSLRNADGKHKALSTISDADNVIGNRNDRFIETLKFMAEKDFVKAIFVSSMPMSQVVWTDYDGIINEVKDSTTTPIFHVPSRSMTDCWLEWYSDLLFSLAKNIDISWWVTKKENVAIVWNLFDRNEWDCVWNVEELKYLLTSLWLNVVSIWLDWGDFESVTKIKDAGTIISLPYWRKAAKKIATRLWADIVELDIPFWFSKTQKFITTLWDHFWIPEVAKNLIAHELTVRNTIDTLKWVIPHTFLWKKAFFYGDPYVLNGFIDICREVWIEIVGAYLHGEEKHLKNNVDIYLDGVPLNNDGEKDAIKQSYSQNEQQVGYDFVVWNAHIDISLLKDVPFVQFWFPSYDYHVYTPTPFYGYRWTMNFLNRIANSINEYKRYQ